MPGTIERDYLALDQRLLGERFGARPAPLKFDGYRAIAFHATGSMK